MTTSSSKRLIMESQLRKMISNEIKKQYHLNENTNLLKEGESKAAWAGAILTLLAGAGMLNPDISFNKIKSKVENMISHESTEVKQPSELTPEEVKEISEKIQSQGWDKVAKEYGGSDALLARLPGKKTEPKTKYKSWKEWDKAYEKMKDEVLDPNYDPFPFDPNSSYKKR